METILECKGLSHKYGKKEVLSDISFNVNAGKIVGLFGPNGSGKTTLIKLITGMICDKEKCITVCGNVVGEKTKCIVSYSPDRVSYRKESKVGELLDMYGLMYEDFDRERAKKNLDVLKINLPDLVGKLSKGNAEKLQIVLTMSRKAKLYVLDEPFNGVDPVSKESIIKIMLEMMTDDSSLIISTHQIGEIEQMLDEAIFIKDGNILFHKSVEDIRSETGKSLADTYMGEYR